LSGRPTVVHVTTTDISLALLLGPQLLAFVEAGYDVVGLSAPGEHREAIEATGARFVALDHATRAMDPRADARFAAELFRMFRRLRPDIVHTHNPKPGLYGRMAARLARVPVVVNTVHGLYAQADDATARRGVVYGLERVAAACSDAELVQNVEDLETLARLRVPRARLTLLGNGVDLARFDPVRLPAGTRGRLRAEMGAGAGAVVVGVVARLVWEKGYRELFAAAAALAAPGTVFVVVGPDDGAKADAVDATARAAAEASGVRFLGMRSDVDELYAAFDVFVLASHREGFPRSAMEAAAMGLPIVATDIRGCRQVVDDGRTGLLVAARDPAALAAAIGTLVADGDLRARMGAAARRKAVAEFDDRRVIAITLATYERLLGSRTLRRP
jgi:glycosyltransferase involved in cell wall biosynthesis